MTAGSACRARAGHNLGTKRTVAGLMDVTAAKRLRDDRVTEKIENEEVRS
jgi:hypothetical protein